MKNLMEPFNHQFGFCSKEDASFIFNSVLSELEEKGYHYEVDEKESKVKFNIEKPA